MNSEISEIFNLLDKFTNLAKKLAKKHPYIVIFLMHDYFRNIWPNDPFISQKYSESKIENISQCLHTCIKILELTQNMGSYFDIEKKLPSFYAKFEKTVVDEEDETQAVYGTLWKKLDEQYLIDETKKELTNVFEKNGKQISELKGKTILDMGCGSGRFTLALADLGASHVTGVDLGNTGIEIGKRAAEKLNLKNIKFIRNSVLALPFDDNYFDFVFCKGVLHHTGNLKTGLNEFHRVLKPNGHSFLYLYGNGGIFWNSRTKMREVMKDIPINYTTKILDIIGMPEERYIFVDSWYVPIEEHVERTFLEEYLSSLNFSKIDRIENTTTSDLKTMNDKTELGSMLYGDGELRYFLTK